MWWIRITPPTHETLALLPSSHGFVVVASSTGNYLGGHGESLEHKEHDLRQNGFMPAAELRQWGHLPSGWRPPKLSHTYYAFAERFGVRASELAAD